MLHYILDNLTLEKNILVTLSLYLFVFLVANIFVLLILNTFFQYSIVLKYLEYYNQKLLN